jgi:hypothetical protein
MRTIKLLAFVVALAVSLAAYASLTNEILVLTTSTAITRSTRTTSVEIQNLGPNDIWCAVDGTPVATKSRKIAASGGTWSLDLNAGVAINCLASTANQVTGAATIVSETP